MPIIPAGWELGIGPTNGLGEPSFPGGTSLLNCEPQRHRWGSLKGQSSPPLLLLPALSWDARDRGTVQGRTSPSASVVCTSDIPLKEMP